MINQIYILVSGDTFDLSDREIDEKRLGYRQLFQNYGNNRSAILISNAEKDALTDLFITPTSGKSDKVYIVSNWSLEKLVTHFRKFLIIKTESNQQLYFRFYDPRVLKIFLPTCDQQQIIEFFGPIEKFIVEGDTKEEAIEFTHQNGNLLQKVIPASEVFNLQPASLPNH